MSMENIEAGEVTPLLSLVDKTNVVNKGRSNNKKNGNGNGNNNGTGSSIHKNPTSIITHHHLLTVQAGDSSTSSPKTNTFESRDDNQDLENGQENGEEFLSPIPSKHNNQRSIVSATTSEDSCCDGCEEDDEVDITLTLLTRTNTSGGNCSNSSSQIATKVVVRSGLFISACASETVIYTNNMPVIAAIAAGICVASTFISGLVAFNAAQTRFSRIDDRFDPKMIRFYRGDGRDVIILLKDFMLEHKLKKMDEPGAGYLLLKYAGKKAAATNSKRQNPFIVSISLHKQIICGEMELCVSNVERFIPIEQFCDLSMDEATGYQLGGAVQIEIKTKKKSRDD